MFSHLLSQCHPKRAQLVPLRSTRPALPAQPDAGAVIPSWTPTAPVTASTSSRAAAAGAHQPTSPAPPPPPPLQPERRPRRPADWPVPAAPPPPSLTTPPKTLPSAHTPSTLLPNSPPQRGTSTATIPRRGWTPHLPLSAGAGSHRHPTPTDAAAGLAPPTRARPTRSSSRVWRSTAGDRPAARKGGGVPRPWRCVPPRRRRRRGLVLLPVVPPVALPRHCCASHTSRAPRHQYGVCPASVRRHAKRPPLHSWS